MTASKSRKRRREQQEGQEKASAAAAAAPQAPQSKNTKLPTTSPAKIAPAVNLAAAAGVSSNWLQLRQQLYKGSAQQGLYRNNKKPSAAITEAVLGSEAAARSGPATTSKSDDDSLTKVVAIDCEMVGVGVDGVRSILARVNAHGNVLYDKHVKPLESVTDFRTAVSGIKAKHLNRFSGAKDFFAVQKEVADLLTGRILIGHALANDLKVLMISHPKKDIRDTAKYKPLRGKSGRPRALRHLALEQLGITIQDGEHNPVDDARAALYLYQKFQKDWERSLRMRHVPGQSLNIGSGIVVRQPVDYAKQRTQLLTDHGVGVTLD
eukprot:jgi/Chlat1/2564/Chrsp175S00148